MTSPIHHRTPRRSSALHTAAVCVKSAQLTGITPMKFEGFLVRYGSPYSLDLDGEYFSRLTFFGTTAVLPVYYQHGTDATAEKMPIGEAKIERLNEGLYAKGVFTPKYAMQMYPSRMKRYHAVMEHIAMLAESGGIGLSSGAAAHLVERMHDGELRQWILCECSLTPTPADPANVAHIQQ